MSNTRKVACLFLLLLMVASSLVIIQFGSAQSITKPSVPEFTLTLESHPYDVPPTTYTNINPSTDETTSSNTAGYRDYNQTVTITIKNQPFNTDPNDTYCLFYDVKIKDYFNPNWTDPWGYFGTSSEYSTIKFYFCNNPPNSQVDVQVQAILQNKSRVFVDNLLPGFPAFLQPDNYGYQYSWVPVASSEWSSIQTINLADGSVYAGGNPSTENSPSITPTSYTTPIALPIATSTQFGVETDAPLANWVEFTTSIVLGIVVALLIVVIAVLSRKVKVLERKSAV